MASGPRTFSPPGSGFSVTLPAEPKGARQDVTTVVGPQVLQNFTVEQDEGALSVATLDIPASALASNDAATLLKDRAAHISGESKGTAVRITEIILGGNPGREIEFSLPDSVVAGGGLGHTRVFLVGPRFIQASAVGTKAFVSAPETDAFFRSLKLVDAK